MAQKINISGKSKWNCQNCGCTNKISFDGSDSGLEEEMKDGNTILSYSCKCRNCGAILRSSYMFLGNLTLDQYNELVGEKNKCDETCYDDSRERDWDESELD